MAFRRSTSEERAEAVALVRLLMKKQNLSRGRAATAVAHSIGFSRNAVIGWCEDAGLYAVANPSDIERLEAEIASYRLVNQRLASSLGVDG